MTIIVSKRVKIPKTDISIETIKKQLIIEGKQNDIFCNREPMTLYKELQDSYIIPAIFGMKYIKENNLEYKDLRSNGESIDCLLYTSPSPRDGLLSRMPSSA